MPAAPKTTKKARSAAIGRRVVTRLGPSKVVGWSGHARPWPLVKRITDPWYFGSVCIQRPDLVSKLCPKAGAT